jgi:hypothetical protein
MSVVTTPIVTQLIVIHSIFIGQEFKTYDSTSTTENGLSSRPGTRYKHKHSTRTAIIMKVPGRIFQSAFSLCSFREIDDSVMLRIIVYTALGWVTVGTFY